MKKEENNPAKCPICGRPTHKESKYCIFHASAVEKTEEEFKEALKEYINMIKEENEVYGFHSFIFVGSINFKEDLNITIFRIADFGEVTFEGYADFGEVAFESFANFGKATFKGDADFAGATFKEDVYFSEVTFRGNANFVHATFEEDVYFSKSTFEGFAYICNTKFKGDAYFKKTIFKAIANFEKTTFKRDAFFEDAIFEEDVYFSEITFRGNANFLVKYFAKNVNFAKSNLFTGKKLNLLAKNEGIISFERTCLENVFLELYLDAGNLIDFTDALLTNTKIKKGQIENHILHEKEKEFSNAQEIFLLLKNNFHSIGQYGDESWAYKKEKDMERKSYCHFKSLHKWLWSCFLNGIFGYGEQPGKVIVSAILVILFFSSFFMISGISNVGIGFNTSNNFLDCLYFSTVTFTTLGYGDFRPLEGLGRILAGSEAFIGAFMMALFVYTFARRTGGR